MRARLLLLGLVLLMLGAPDAEARRRGVPIPIPSFGRSDRMVKVADLPKRAPFIDKRGRQIDLGYLWPAKGAPQWVGYLSDTEFYRWTDVQVEMAMTLAGMTLPPVPERPTDLSSVGGWGGLFWIGLLSLGLIASLWKKFITSVSEPQPAMATVTAGAVATPADAPAKWRAGPVLRKHAAPMPTAPASAEQRRQPRTLVTTVATAGAPRASFGRRA